MRYCLKLLSPPNNLCFAETNVSLIPDACNSKIYSKNDKNLLQSEEDVRVSRGFQHGTKGGGGGQSSLTEYNGQTNE